MKIIKQKNVVNSRSMRRVLWEQADTKRKSIEEVWNGTGYDTKDGKDENRLKKGTENNDFVKGKCAMRRE